jgi:hypothetical protein
MNSMTIIRRMTCDEFSCITSCARAFLGNSYFCQSIVLERVVSIMDELKLKFKVTGSQVQYVGQQK